MIKILICVNFTVFITYISELFPSKVRGFAYCAAIFSGKLTAPLFIMFRNITDRFGLHPFVGTGFICLITLPVTLLMPETVGKSVDN